MKESILFFDERVLNNGIDTSEFQDVFTALQQGEYQRVDLKPLKGKKGYFRAKTNKKGRIILTTLAREGKTYLVVVEHLPEHNYHSSKSLHATKKLNIEEFKDQLDQEDKDLFETIFQECQTHDYTQVKAFCVNQTYLTLSQYQIEAKNSIAPLIIHGLPGSGKTVMLLYFSLNFILQNPHSGSYSSSSSCSSTDNFDRSIGFYVAASAPFIHSVKLDWQRSTSVPQGEDRIKFLTYHEFAIAQNQVFRNKKPVGVNQFIAWANKRKIGNLNARTIYKDLRFVSICKSFEDYQQIGVRNLHYHQNEAMRLIWTLYQDYKQYLGDTLIDWAFAEFKITQFCDLLCVDETQDLSPIQIVQLILSAKNQQYYLAMDVNQSLFMDISIRPLLMQLLAKHNNHIIPNNVFLHANHRMPQPIANLASLLLQIKNHIIQGVVDSQDSFTLNDIQGNDQPGEVRMILKPDPEDRKPELDLTISSEIDTLTEHLKSIARDPDTAFIVPNEFLREKIISEYHATQVFLADEAKGLQWKKVVAIGMISASDALSLFQQANQNLPENAQQFQKKFHRPKNKEDNASSEYNSAFAPTLVAISRCTESLIIIETYSRKIVNLLRLLQHAVSQPTFSLPVNQAKPFNRQRWVEQIHALIGQGAMTQAIAAARQELGLNVPEDISDDSLLALLSKPQVENSIGIPVIPDKRKPSRYFKKKNTTEIAKSIPSANSSSRLSSAKPKQGKLFDQVVQLILQQCSASAKAIDKLINQLDNILASENFIQLDFLLKPNVQMKLMEAQTHGSKLLGYFFEKAGYNCDENFLTKLFINKDKSIFSPLLIALFADEFGVELFFTLFEKIPAFERLLLTGLNHTVISGRAELLLYFTKSEMFYWLHASSMPKNITRFAIEYLNQKLDAINEKQLKLMDYTSLTRDQLFELCHNIIKDPHLFTQLFFVSGEMNTGKYSTPLFHTIAADDILMTWFIEFLNHDSQAKLIFDNVFGPECLIPRGISTQHKKIPIGRAHHFKRHYKLSETAQDFILSYLSDPACVLASDTKSISYLHSGYTEPILDICMWQTILSIINIGNLFLVQLQFEDSSVIIEYLDKTYPISAIKGLDWEYRDNINWEALPENPDIIDILLLCDKGIHFMNWVVEQPWGIRYAKTIGQRIYNGIYTQQTPATSTLFHRLITCENGIIFLKALQKIDSINLMSSIKMTADAKNPLKDDANEFIFLGQVFPVLNKNIENHRYSDDLEKIYTHFINVFFLGQSGTELVTQCHFFLSHDPYYSYDARIPSLSELSVKHLPCSTKHPVQQQITDLTQNVLYKRCYQRPSGSIFIDSLWDDNDVDALIRAVFASLPQYASMNLPMELLISEPFQQSVYVQLASSTNGCFLLETLLRIRAFSLETITAQQLEACSELPGTDVSSAISLFYHLTVTAGERGHEKLLELVETSPNISKLCTYETLTMQDRSFIYKGVDPNMARLSQPIVILLQTESGKKFIEQCRKHNSNTHDKLSPSKIEYYSAISAMMKLYHQTLSDNLANKTTAVMLQSYIQGKQYQDRHLLFQLCSPNCLDQFNQLLDDPLISETPITLKHLMDNYVMSRLRHAGTKGITVISKLFRNARFYNDSSELPEFFTENAMDRETHMHWLMKRKEGVQFLLESIDQSRSLFLYCLDQFKFITEMGVRTQANLNLSNSEVVAYYIANNLKTNPVLEQVMDESHNKIRQLTSLYNCQVERLITHFDQDVFLKFLSTVFKSRNFNYLFFTLDQKSHKSIYAQIMLDEKLTTCFLQFLNSDLIYKTKFQRHWNYFSCVFPIFTRRLPWGNPFRLPRLAERFLFDYLLHPPTYQLDRSENIKSMLSMTQHPFDLYDPTLWMTINLARNPDSEFIHLLGGCDVNTIKVYLERSFSGKSLKDWFIESIAPMKPSEFFGADFDLDIYSDVFNMMDLLALSNAGTSFIFEFLSCQQSWFIKPLANRFLSAMNDQFVKPSAFIRNILRRESSTLIVAGLSNLLPEEFKSFNKKLAKLANADDSQIIQGNDQYFINWGKDFNLSATHYHFYEGDSRAHKVYDIMNHYVLLREELETSLFNGPIVQTIESYFAKYALSSTGYAFIYNLFYAKALDFISTICATEDTRDQFLIVLLKNIFLLPSKNLPMGRFIDEPYSHCLYSTLLPFSLGRQLIGSFFHIRTFGLGLITPQQLIYSIKAGQQYTQDTSFISLFFILSVTAGDKGHDKLLEIITEDVARALKARDLHTPETGKIFPANNTMTPYSCLSATTTGQLILERLYKMNPKLTPSSYAQTASARLWQPGQTVTDGNVLELSEIRANQTM